MSNWSLLETIKTEKLLTWIKTQEFQQEMWQGAPTKRLEKIQCFNTSWTALCQISSLFYKFKTT